MRSLWKAPAVVWGDAVLLLIGGSIGLVLAYFLRLQPLVTFSKGFIVIVFIMEAIYFALSNAIFMKSRLFNTQGAIALLMFILIAVIDMFLPAKWAASQGNKENQTNEENADQSPEEKEETQAEAEAQEATTNTTGIVSDLANFRLFTLVLSILVWFCLMMRGMVSGASLGSTYKLFKESKTVINPMFQDFFHYLTLIYCNGMYILNDSPPMWFFFAITAPMVVLPFFSTFIAFYVAKPTIAMNDAIGVFNCFLAGALIYISFKMFFNHHENLAGLGMKDKFINLGIIVFAFLWKLLILNINQMNTEMGSFDFDYTPDIDFPDFNFPFSK